MTILDVATIFYSSESAHHFENDNVNDLVRISHPLHTPRTPHTHPRHDAGGSLTGETRRVADEEGKQETTCV